MRRWLAWLFYAELAGEAIGWLIYRRFMRTAQPATRPATGKVTQ